MKHPETVTGFAVYGGTNELKNFFHFPSHLKIFYIFFQVAILIPDDDIPPQRFLIQAVISA